MGTGGAERVAATLANAWVARGDQVILMPTFSGRGECFYQLSADVRLVYLADMISTRSSRLFTRWQRLRTLRRFIASEAPDVIVSFLSNVNVAAIMASAGLRIPVIVCERIDPFAMPMPRSLKIACRITYPYADAVMVQTEAVAKKYKDAGWPLRHVPVIPNPLPEQMADLQRAAGDKPDRRLLAIGRMDEQKQFALLIKIFSRLTDDNPEWTLRILGDGPLRGDLQQQIGDLGLSDRIELPGRSSNIGQELVAADVFVLSSAYEGFPNALLEAMAAGLPCVTFDCPSGPRDMTRNGQDAFLVPMGDETLFRERLNDLMNDGALRIRMGKQARESVIARYSLPPVLAKWDALFKRVGIRR